MKKISDLSKPNQSPYSQMQASHTRGPSGKLVRSPSGINVYPFSLLIIFLISYQCLLINGYEWIFLCWCPLHAVYSTASLSVSMVELIRIFWNRFWNRTVAVLSVTVLCAVDIIFIEESRYLRRYLKSNLSYLHPLDDSI